MTLIGTWVGGPDHAFAWADTEVYRDDEPVGHRIKLAVNSVAGIAAVHAGDTGGLDAVAEAVRYATSFDQLLIGLPVLLRQAADDSARLPRFAGHVPRWICGAVGRSRQCGRIVAAILEAKSNFVPALSARGFCRPYLLEFDSFSANISSDLIGLAQRQMVQVKKEVPSAGAGVVSIARVQPDLISIESFDIETGRRSAQLPRFAEAAT